MFQHRENRPEQYVFAVNMVVGIVEKDRILKRNQLFFTIPINQIGR